jgi:hypothetical protein
VNPDFEELLQALLEAGARFLLVGAHAMAAHGVPRATGDLDVWVDPQPENAACVWRALLRFGAPVRQLGVSPSDLEAPGMVIQLGVPPRRIDILTSLTGLVFEVAWRTRETHTLGSLQVPVLGRAELIRNKRATGRPKDLADLEVLERGAT